MYKGNKDCHQDLGKLVKENQLMLSLTKSVRTSNRISSLIYKFSFWRGMKYFEHTESHIHTGRQG